MGIIKDGYLHTIGIGHSTEAQRADASRIVRTILCGAVHRPHVNLDCRSYYATHWIHIGKGDGKGHFRICALHSRGWGNVANGNRVGIVVRDCACCRVTSWNCGVSAGDC